MQPASPFPTAMKVTARHRSARLLSYWIEDQPHLPVCTSLINRTEGGNGGSGAVWLADSPDTSRSMLNISVHTHQGGAEEACYTPTVFGFTRRAWKVFNYTFGKYGRTRQEIGVTLGELNGFNDGMSGWIVLDLGTKQNHQSENEN